MTDAANALDAARAEARKAYDAAPEVVEARKVYNAAMADPKDPDKAYDAPRDKAAQVYNDATAGARKAFVAATAEARKVYNDTLTRTRR